VASKPLDPTPWRGYDWSRKSRYSRFACIFDPRPEFEQDRERYEEESQ
jgi:hypothetical protein